jgi:C4-dicarboxylate-specific signal transduction histidine kinase
MAGAVAHDLNNVLTAVIGNLSLLDEGGVGDAETVAQIVGEALAAARRGVSLSEELEAFAGKLRLEVDAVDASRLVEQAVGQMPQQRGAPPPQLDLFPEPLRVRTDPARFRRAIAGACMGVIRAMSIRADKLRIETAPAADADGRIAARITMVGEGEGVIEAALAEAFSNFRSGFRTGAWSLSSVAGFVAQSGGKFDVHTEGAHCLRLTLDFPALGSGEVR